MALVNIVCKMHLDSHPSGDGPPGVTPPQDVPTIYENKFFETLGEFLENLKVTFPENENRFDALRNAVCVGRCDSPHGNTLHNLVKRLAQYEKQIMNNDDALFSDAQGSPVCLLPGIDFRALWIKNVSASSKKAIWQFLQLLLMLGRSAGVPLNEQPRKEALIPEKMIESQASKSRASALPNPVEELAAEMLEELDIKSNNPNDLLGKLFGGEGGFAATIEKMSGKVKSRIDSGQLTETNLLEGMRGMIKNLSSLHPPSDGEGAPGAKGIQDTMEACLRALETGGSDPNAMQDILKNLNVGQGGRNGPNLASMVQQVMKTVMQSNDTSSGGGGGLELLKSFMGGESEDGELMDLQELEKKVRRDMRKDYRSKRDRHIQGVTSLDRTNRVKKSDPK